MVEITQIADHQPAFASTDSPVTPRPIGKPGLAEPPLVSIIITHFNYSDHVEAAIRSVLTQTHTNWECVVVDDCSDKAHAQKVSHVVGSFSDDRVRLELLDENVGQIHAFFSGLEKTSGEFVCLLDPDDRYTPTFLEDVLAAHLNLFVMCPLVCTDQILVTDRGIIGSGLCSKVHLAAMQRRGQAIELVEPASPRLLYYPASASGWHWTSTSAMMFRRSAIKYMRPRKPLSYRGNADSYLAQAAHAIGGSLFLAKGLIYRTMHDNNAWIKSEIYASSQDRRRPDGPRSALQAHLDCIEAMRTNGLPADEQERADRSTALPGKRLRRMFRKWKKSLKKRMN